MRMTRVIETTAALSAASVLLFGVSGCGDEPAPHAKDQTQAINPRSPNTWSDNYTIRRVLSVAKMMCQNPNGEPMNGDPDYVDGWPRIADRANKIEDVASKLSAFINPDLVAEQGVGRQLFTLQLQLDCPQETA